MKKIAQGIVRLRKLILTVAFLLLIPSAIGAIATRINYDILTYLPQDLDSMIGEVALEDDFHLASTGMITVEGLPTNELIAMKKDIEAVPGVTQTFWLSDVIDPSIPTEMLPADVQQFMFGKNDSTMLIVRFDAPSASDETMEAVAQIEKLLRKDCFFGGMSVILQDTKALVNQDVDLARHAIEADEEIDRQERIIEDLCLKLLLQQQPVAKDLRLISSALKMITDMERIGDHASDISEITIALADQPYIKKLEHIQQMAKETMIMLVGSIEAFVDKDLEKANEVIKRDDVVDDLFDKVKKELIQMIHENADKGEQAADLLMVAKYMERIGDHATNISEWVIFSITGEHKSMN